MSTAPPTEQLLLWGWFLKGGTQRMFCCLQLALAMEQEENWFHCSRRWEHNVVPGPKNLWHSISRPKGLPYSEHLNDKYTYIS